MSSAAMSTAVRANTVPLLACSRPALKRTSTVTSGRFSW